MSENNKPLDVILNDMDAWAKSKNRELTKVAAEAEIPKLDFAASLSTLMKTAEFDKGVDTSLLTIDAKIGNYISKYAGLQPFTNFPEDIKSYLKEFMINELSFFPEKVTVNVEIKPLKTSATKNSEVEIIDATGTIDVTFNNALIQIPYMMRDKEILPFDVIQMGNETAFYSRENLKNVMFNILSIQKKQTTSMQNQAQTGVESFVGVDKPVNTLTDAGFMTDMMHIQSRMSNSSTYDRHVHSATLDSLLEKTASDNNFIVFDEKAEKERLLPDYTDKAEKLASLDLGEEANEFEKLAFFNPYKDAVLGNVNLLKNGQRFLFVEVDGHTINEVPAVYVKTMNSLLTGDTLNHGMILSIDGRYSILKPGELFSYIVGKDSADFDIPAIPATNLNPGRLYSLSLKDTAYSAPFAVVKAYSGKDYSIWSKRIYQCRDTEGNMFTLITDENAVEGSMAIMSKENFLSRMVGSEAPEHVGKYAVIIDRNYPVVLVSEVEKAVELYQDHINVINNTAEIAYLMDSNIKLASYGDYIRITKIGDGRYDLAVEYFDSKFRMQRSIRKEGLSANRIAYALKTIGFRDGDATNIMFRLESSGSVEMRLDERKRPWLLKPDTTALAATEDTITNLRDSVLNENFVTRKILPVIMGSILGSVVSGTKAGDIMANMKDFKVSSDESAALASKFEKLAGEFKSQGMLDVAKLMVIKSRIDEALDKVASDDSVGYSFEIFDTLAGCKDLIEKTAADVVNLKVRQFVDKNELVSFNTLQSTLTNLDDLYKYAGFATAADREAAIAQAERAVADMVPEPTKPIKAILDPNKGVGKAVNWGVENPMKTMLGAAIIPGVGTKLTGVLK